MLDESMTLPDGRTLAYTDCGAIDGPLVLYFHGAPTSRLDVVAFDDAFTAAGVRVVSPDRPGYGGSSPREAQTFDTWAADVTALADHVGRDRFAVMGISAGGPYVVACAALLPDTVAGAGVVAGVTDMGWPPALEDFSDDDEAAVMALADDAAAVAWCEEKYGNDGAGFLSGELRLAPADEEVLADESLGAGFLVSLVEGLRQGVTGYARDMRVYTRPWTFDARAITAPVVVLHGEADLVVPVSQGRHTAELIPGARLATFPHHGHLSIIREIPSLAAELAQPLS